MKMVDAEWYGEYLCRNAHRIYLPYRIQYFIFQINLPVDRSHKADDAHNCGK